MATRSRALELVLGDGIPEQAALQLGNLELERGGLALSRRTGKRTRAPRRS